MFETSLLLGCLRLGMDPVLALSIVDEISDREPNALSVRGREDELLVAVSREEAVSLAMGLLGAGHTLGLGLTGVPSTELGRLGASVPEALDPCTNLRLGETLWTEALGGVDATLSGDEAVRAATGRYRAGSGGSSGSGDDAIDEEFVAAVWARRAASERSLAEVGASATASRRDRDAAAPSAADAAPEPARRARSSTVTWTPRTAVPGDGRAHDARAARAARAAAVRASTASGDPAATDGTTSVTGSKR